MKQNGSYYYYRNDHLGTPMQMTDSDGLIVWEAKYDAFGKAAVEAGSTITNNLRFPGQYYDSETGLHYNWHRYYNPETGRYLRVDPIGIKGGVNLYGYVAGNPLFWSDPLGLEKFCTDWIFLNSGWVPTGNTTGNKERILQSEQMIEIYVPALPYRLIETYYSEELKKIRVKKRTCFEIDDCGKMHEIDEFEHDDLGKRKWRDVQVYLELVPWNDPRLIPKPPPDIL